LSLFEIAKEWNQQLVEWSFEQWREAHSKNTKQNGRHLGKKELKLEGVLDGEEIARLAEVRNEADGKKSAK